MIFNSLGSNYNLDFVVKSLFANNNSKNTVLLKKNLEERYSGKVVLFYKGRESIQFGLQILNLPQGSFVAICGFTCFAVYDAICKSGLNAEYLDIENDLNFSAETLKNHINKNPKIKVVIVQNTFGYPCDIEKIKKICEEKNIFLIEDLAHSIGTKYKNAQAGSAGDLVTLSFSQDKIVDGISGGALITRNKKLSINDIENFKNVNQQTIDRLYPLFTYLIRKTYPIYLGKILHAILKKLNLLSNPMKSSSSLHLLPPWYCSLICNQFDFLEESTNHRKKISSIYATHLDKSVLISEIVEKVENSTNLRFPILVDKRVKLIQCLQKFGIFISDIWYDSPIAPKKYMHLTNYKNQCPISEKISEQILNLPTHKNVSVKDAIEISERINKWLKSQ